MQIILFGQLTDITGNNTIAVNNVADTDELVQALITMYPAMAGTKYVIALDKKIVQGNTVLSEAANVALMPAFSGG
ncbi:MAG: MoaD/ThiS family protein [Chitinophagaceae bacterium]